MIYFLALAVEYVSTSVIFFDFLEIFPQTKHTVMNPGLASCTNFLQMSFLVCLEKSLAKVSGKMNLIKICKRTTKFNGNVYSSHYYID